MLPSSNRNELNIQPTIRELFSSAKNVVKSKYEGAQAGHFAIVLFSSSNKSLDSTLAFTFWRMHALFYKLRAPKEQEFGHREEGGLGAAIWKLKLEVMSAHFLLILAWVISITVQVPVDAWLTCHCRNSLWRKLNKFVTDIIKPGSSVCGTRISDAAQLTPFSPPTGVPSPPAPAPPAQCPTRCHPRSTARFVIFRNFN